MSSITSALSWQVDPDDVLTKEEQIYLLVEAKERCQRHIKAQLEMIQGSVHPCAWVSQPQHAPWEMPFPLMGEDGA